MELLPPTHESSSERLFLTFHPSESTRSTSSTTKIYNWQSLRVHHSWSYRFLHRSYCAVSVATQCRRRMEARIHGFSNYWAISQHFLLGSLSVVDGVCLRSFHALSFLERIVDHFFVISCLPNTKNSLRNYMRVLMSFSIVMWLLSPISPAIGDDSSLSGG